MKYVTAALLAVGTALLALILYRSDLTEVWIRLQQIGVWGITLVLALFFVVTVLETVSWQLKLPSIRPLTPAWIYRLWKVRLVGEAFNIVTPLASMGGEPLKAVLVKKRYGIGYGEASASLVLEQTVQNLALIAFLTAGFFLTFTVDALSASQRLAAGSGLALFSLAIVLFFLVQRLRLSSRLGGRLGDRVASVLQHVREFEGRLIDFYTRHRARFALSLAIEFVIWMLSAVEIFLILRFLGYAATFTEAWVVAAVVVLVRSALFFVPAGIGMQEGTFLLICGAITGSPILALAVSLIVRFRELVWVALGLGIGWSFSIDTARAAPPASVPSRGPDMASPSSARYRTEATRHL